MSENGRFLLILEITKISSNTKMSINQTFAYNSKKRRYKIFVVNTEFIFKKKKGREDVTRLTGQNRIEIKQGPTAPLT